MAPPSTVGRPRAKRYALAVAVGYGVIAAIWIALTSAALSWLHVREPIAVLAKYEILKGWGFAIVTMGALYLVLARLFGRLELAEQSERAALQRYQGVLEITPVAVFIQQRGKLVSVNDEGAKILGAKSVNEVLGRNALDLVRPESSARISELVERYAEKGLTSPVVTERLLRLDGTARDVQMTVGPSEYRGRRAVQTIIHDITELSRQEELLAQRFTHDSVTGLPNVTVLRDRLAQAIAHARRSQRQIVVLIFDVVHFQHIIDKFGYQGGDEVLRALASRLPSLVREGDTVARISGDEFAIALTDVRNPEDARNAVDKILAAAAQPIEYRGEAIGFAVTTGVAIYPGAGKDADSLMQHANMAMLHAKSVARGSVEYYAASTGEAARERARIGAELHNAVERNELALHYQPQVSADSGEIIGCESLLRWTSPALGRVSPGLFVPIAEDLGLIEGIGLWALRQACRQAKAWHDAGQRPIAVSVNVSSRQLRHPGFVASVREVLGACALEASWIELELTESMLMRDVEGAVARVQALKDLGIKIAIDDFGTGYSNLAELRRFPADRLKVDQSFVRGMDRPDAAAIVRTIIALGQALRMRVIAEGVETEEQARTLREWGCHEFQGYLFGRPMDAETFTARLRGEN